MTDRFSVEMTGVADGTQPAQLASGAVVNAGLRTIRATINLASQPAGDNILLGIRPRGSTFAYGVLNGDTSLGSAVVAIGASKTHASNEKYRAAATHTATVPTLFGKPSAADDAPLTDDEAIYLTINTAALPSSGILVVDIVYRMAG